MSSFKKLKKFVSENKVTIIACTGIMVAVAAQKFLPGTSLAEEVGDAPEESPGSEAAARAVGALMYLVASPIDALRKELSKNNVCGAEIEDVVNRFHSDPDAAIAWTYEAIRRRSAGEL
mgnify:FL=1